MNRKFKRLNQGSGGASPCIQPLLPPPSNLSLGGAKVHLSALQVGTCIPLSTPHICTRIYGLAVLHDPM